MYSLQFKKLRPLRGGGGKWLDICDKSMKNGYLKFKTNGRYYMCLIDIEVHILQIQKSV